MKAWTIYFCLDLDAYSNREWLHAVDSGQNVLYIPVNDYEYIAWFPSKYPIQYFGSKEGRITRRVYRKNGFVIDPHNSLERIDEKVWAVHASVHDAFVQDSLNLRDYSVVENRKKLVDLENAYIRYIVHCSSPGSYMGSPDEHTNYAIFARSDAEAVWIARKRFSGIDSVLRANANLLRNDE